LQSKVDYIEDLGVKGVALSSLLKVSDGGPAEAVEDFKDIDPRYGTLEEFKSLVESLKSKGKYFWLVHYMLTKSVPGMARFFFHVF
jgi:glycosidase